MTLSTVAEHTNQDGMGNLRITEKGLKLEGDSEFLQPLYAKEIQSRPGNALYFKSARNVTVNILNEQTKVLTQLITGPKAVEAYGKKFEVKTVSGKLLFSADNNEVVVGAERLRVLGAEGTVFPKSIETPNVRADPFKELRLESPTRSLVMEAPKGVEINAEAGNMEATCRTELRLESKDGEVLRRILASSPETKSSSKDATRGYTSCQIKLLTTNDAEATLQNPQKVRSPPPSAALWHLPQLEHNKKDAGDDQPAKRMLAPHQWSSEYPCGIVSTDKAHVGTGDNQTAGGDKPEDESQHIKDEREYQDPCRPEQPYHLKLTPPRFLRIREN
ncbi:hypothetical protein E5288_WYG019288 [Bos mutus]|uniref:Delta-sarcoglycan n=2 Tax=Bos mutus TaxID=72004 RepID=A0A6B0RC56_9CETA|nr:hypothetical protein [Bos mutus]